MVQFDATNDKGKSQSLQPGSPGATDEVLSESGQERFFDAENIEGLSVLQEKVKKYFTLPKDDMSEANNELKTQIEEEYQRLLDLYAGKSERKVLRDFMEFNFYSQLNSEPISELVEKNETNTPEINQFDEKDFAEKIEDYNRTLANYKNLESEISKLKKNVWVAGWDDSKKGDYSPPVPRVTTAQIMNIQGKQDEKTIIEEALAEKGNKIKANALVYFESATTDVDLEKRREKLQDMITDGDLRHDALHGFTIEMFKRHPEKMNPSKEAQKPAEKIVPTPFEKLISSEPQIQPKVEPIKPPSAPPSPDDQIDIEKPQIEGSADDTFIAKEKRIDPSVALQKVFASDENAYDAAKEAELKAAQQMDSSVPDTKKPAGEEKPAMADRVSGGQLEIQAPEDKKDEISATPMIQPPVQPPTAGNNLAEKKTTEPVQEPKGMLKINPDGTLIAEKVEPVAQNLKSNQNATTNQYATESKPGNPAEARIAEIKQSLQNKLPDNLNAGKGASSPEISKPEPIAKPVMEPVETKTTDTNSKTEAEVLKAPPVTSDKNITVDKVEPILPGIPATTAPQTQEAPPAPAPLPEKKKGFLGRIFGNFLKEKDPDAGAAAALEKGKVEVSAVESKSKRE